MAWKWPWKRDGAVVPERKSATGFVALHGQGEARWTRRTTPHSPAKVSCATRWCTDPCG